MSPALYLQMSLFCRLCAHTGAKPGKTPKLARCTGSQAHSSPPSRVKLSEHKRNCENQQERKEEAANSTYVRTLLQNGDVSLGVVKETLLPPTVASKGSDQLNCQRDKGNAAPRKSFYEAGSPA